MPCPEVSIHAPAWGATKLQGLDSTWLRVSIHAPAWGATDSDPDLSWLVTVSIHAPAWGATCAFRWRRVTLPCFNPRTRMGCDPEGIELLVSRDGVSIHAPAWGATFAPRLLGIWFVFQSTHPHGVRRMGSQDQDLESKVSIHAPAWGATIMGCVRPVTWQVSIHAPAWGATTPRSLCRQTGLVSIHAPAWGATVRVRERPSQGARFNPRTRMGCDVACS